MVSVPSWLSRIDPPPGQQPPQNVRQPKFLPQPPEHQRPADAHAPHRFDLLPPQRVQHGRVIAEPRQRIQQPLELAVLQNGDDLHAREAVGDGGEPFLDALDEVRRLLFEGFAAFDVRHDDVPLMIGDPLRVGIEVVVERKPFVVDGRLICGKHSAIMVPSA